MNQELPIIHSLLHLVLIDTWWNVNEEIKGDKMENDMVLIDTWWNVNSFFLLERVKGRWF